MSESILNQFGFIADPNKQYSVQDLLAYEIELLGAKQSSVFNDFAILLSDKHGTIKRQIRNGYIELINMQTNNTISKRALCCPLI